MPRRTIGAIVALLTVGAVNSVAATPISWSMTGGASNTSGAMGNTRAFTNGDATVTATAWSRLGTGASTGISSAYLGYYSHGLGVTNANEHGGGYSHTMDNDNGIDLIMFAFDSAMVLTAAVLAPFGSSSSSRDSDISIWIGAVANPLALSLAGMTLGDLDATFTRLPDNTTTSSSSRTASFDTGSAASNIVIFSAVQRNDRHVDYIKVAGVSGVPSSFEPAPVYSSYSAAGPSATTENEVSEPGGLGLFVLALIVLGQVVRRRALQRSGDHVAPSPSP
jgi:hypothetical protein